VSDTTDAPVPYRVAYSERVREELRGLLAKARERGVLAQALEAVKEIDRRLHLYPQFGEPLRELTLESAQLWIGTVPPLVLQYVIDEENRLVIVVAPFRPLPDSGL
jgi:hypothetical protein